VSPLTSVILIMDKNCYKERPKPMKCFQSRWRHKYLTSLYEFHCTSPTNQGNIVSVHDDGLRINQSLTVVTRLLVGSYGITSTAEICTSMDTTNWPIAKLSPLEVNSPTKSNASQRPNQTPAEVTASTQTVLDETESVSAVKAKALMSDWAQTLCAPLGDVETET